MNDSFNEIDTDIRLNDDGEFAFTSKTNENVYHSSKEHLKNSKAQLQNIVK